ncbi:hypothetical protein [Streptomyces sp. A5-4]
MRTRGRRGRTNGLFETYPLGTPMDRRRRRTGDRLAAHCLPSGL